MSRVGGHELVGTRLVGEQPSVDPDVGFEMQGFPIPPLERRQVEVRFAF